MLYGKRPLCVRDELLEVITMSPWRTRNIATPIMSNATNRNRIKTHGFADFDFSDRVPIHSRRPAAKEQLLVTTYRPWLMCSWCWSSSHLITFAYVFDTYVLLSRLVMDACFFVPTALMEHTMPGYVAYTYTADTTGIPHAIISGAARLPINACK